MRSARCPEYRDDNALWAQQRRRIDEGEGNATVLIGARAHSSTCNCRFGNDCRARQPIQLALDGTSPVYVLEDLADDPAFTGRLLIGIAPDIYFSGFEYQKNYDRYTRKESPSQRVGKFLSMHLIDLGWPSTILILRCLPCFAASHGPNARV